MLARVLNRNCWLLAGTFWFVIFRPCFGQAVCHPPLAVWLPALGIQGDAFSHHSCWVDRGHAASWLVGGAAGWVWANIWLLLSWPASWAWCT